MNDKYIEIVGARANNLKNINVKIPRNKFVVITGLSGSGKSSLAFDTLYAEGQRRYVESLSAYARQFLGRMSKPECDFIKGLPPAIAVEQKVNNKNSRSTVGTSTEIYDYLRLLFAKIGKTYSPISGCVVEKHTSQDVVNAINKFDDGTRFAVLTALSDTTGRDAKSQLDTLIFGGYSRLEKDGKFYPITDVAKTIENQKLILEKYVMEQGWNLIDEYIDDGYSGTTFDRPSVQRLLEDAKCGRINTTRIKLNCM